MTAALEVALEGELGPVGLWAGHDAGVVGAFAE
jgi:hypothetical protein